MYGIHHALADAGGNDGTSGTGYRRSQKRSSKLEPFVPIIDEIHTTDRHQVHREQRGTR
jgi:hypothetical protein